MKLSKWLIPQLLIFFFLGLKLEIALAFFWIILHEFAHYIIAIKIGAGVENFKVHFLGAALELEDYEELTQFEQISICLAGPIFNYICAGFFYFIYRMYGGWFIYSCFEVNIVLAIFNSIPAYPLDGSRILNSYLSTKMLFKQASKITAYISYFVGGIFVFLFFTMLFYIHKLNIIILAAGIFIIYETYLQKRRVMYIIMGDIIKKRELLIKRKFIDNRFISVYYNQSLINILGLVDKSRFHIFYVLNDDMNLVYILREDELMEALKLHGNISLKEYYNIRNSFN